MRPPTMIAIRALQRTHTGFSNDADYPQTEEVAALVIDNGYVELRLRKKRCGTFQPAAFTAPAITPSLGEFEIDIQRLTLL